MKKRFVKLPVFEMESLVKLFKNSCVHRIDPDTDAEHHVCTPQMEGCILRENCTKCVKHFLEQHEVEWLGPPTNAWVSKK